MSRHRHLTRIKRGATRTARRTGCRLSTTIRLAGIESSPPRSSTHGSSAEGAVNRPSAIAAQRAFSLRVRDDRDSSPSPGADHRGQTVRNMHVPTTARRHDFDSSPNGSIVRRPHESQHWAGDRGRLHAISDRHTHAQAISTAAFPASPDLNLLLAMYLKYLQFSNIFKPGDSVIRRRGNWCVIRQQCSPIYIYWREFDFSRNW